MAAMVSPFAVRLNCNERVTAGKLQGCGHGAQRFVNGTFFWGAT